MFSGHGIIGGGLGAGIGNMVSKRRYTQQAQVEHLHAESEKARVETQMEQENLDAIRKMRAGISHRRPHRNLVHCFHRAAIHRTF